MECLGGLLIVLFALLAVAAVGHALWLVFAGLVRLVSGRSGAEEPPTRPEECARCGELTRPGQTRCAACGLRLTGGTAQALRDLAATLRQLQRFRDDGTLDAAAFEALRRKCQDARQRLDRAPSEERMVPAWQRLARLLEGTADVGGLPSAERRRALAWHRAAEPAQLAGLSAAAQLALARLLHREGDRHAALRAYARLLKTRPEDVHFAEAAVEGAECAAQARRLHMARWFVEQALGRAPPAALRQRAEALLRALGPEEEITDVLPAEPAPPRAQALPETAPAESVPARPPAALVAAVAAPRRSAGEVLAAFMEERNILWGELVGGLLIVGCSVALVISLWERLEAIPYFPFLIFAGITAALFGAGLYTLHHWRLESTSRGLLVIALLLVPLNFIVLAGLSAGRSADFVEVGTELTALAAFVGLVGLAARVIVPGAPRLLTLGLMGPVAGQLLVPRLLTPGQAALAPFLLLGCAPVGCYILATGIALFRARRAALQERSARDALALLGLASFALAVALGFLVYRAGELPLALGRLAVPVALSGIPVLLGGLLVYRADLSATLRTVGSAVGLAGMGLMLAAALQAWPRPGTLIAVCVLDFAVLSAVALTGRLPLAHAAALPCLAVAYLAGFHLVAGHLDVPGPELGRHLLDLAASPASGTALIALVVLLAGASGLFVRRGREPDAFSYAAGTVALALVSLVLVALGGRDEPGRAALTAGVYAAVALALNLHWRRAWLAYAGLGLIALATLWGIHHGGLLSPALRALVMAAESLVLAGLAVLSTQVAGARILRRTWDTIPTPAWRDTAAAAAVLALSLTSAAPGSVFDDPHAATAAILAVTACALAWLYRWAPLACLGSALLLAAILHALLVTFHRPAAPLTFAGALLAHANLVLALAAAAPGPADRPLRRVLAGPLRDSGLLVTALAVPPLLLALGPGEIGTAAALAGWLAGLWLVVAWAERWPVLFSLGQGALAAAILLGVTRWLLGRDWVADNLAGLADPRSLQAYGAALAAFSLGWMAFRAGLRRAGHATELLDPPWPSVDRVVLGAVVVGQLVVAVAAILPGVAGELTPAGAVAAEWPAPLAHGHGPGAWGLLLAVAVGTAAALRERPAAAVMGLLLSAVTVPALVAGAFDGQRATASALRWGLAIGFVVASAPLWLRHRLAPLAAVLRIPAAAEPVSVWGRQLLVAATAGPVLVLTCLAVVTGFSGPTAGPDAASFFARIGGAASDVLPVVLLGGGLLGYALRDRLPGYAFAAGLCVNLAASLVVWHLHRADPFASWGVALLQANATASAAAALLWLWWRRQGYGPPEQRVGAESLISVQVGLGLCGNALLTLLPLAALVLAPGRPLPPELAAAGNVGGWVALALTAAAALGLVAQSAPRGRLPVIVLTALAAGVLAACFASLWDTGNWLAYHVLLAGWGMTAAALPVASVIARPVPRDDSHALLAPAGVLRWAAAAGLAATVLALGGAWDDPHRPYWSAAAVLSVAGGQAVLALWLRRSACAYASGLLMNVVGLLAWLAWGADTATSFVSAQVLCLAIGAAVWSAAETALRTGTPPAELRGPAPPFSHAALAAGLILLAPVVGVQLATSLGGPPAPGSALPWAALLAMAVALVVALWDGRAVLAPAGLYAAGLLAVGLGLADLPAPPARLARTACLLLAGCALLTAVIDGAAARLTDLRRALGMPHPPQTAWSRAWFLPAQAAAAAVALALSVGVSVGFDAAPDRLAGPLAVALLAAAAFVLAGRGPGRAARYVTLLLGAAFLTELGWAALDPAVAAVAMHRGVLLMTALAVATVAYGVGLARGAARWPPWAEAGRRLGPVLGVLALLVLVAVLGQEFLLYDPDPTVRRTPMLGWAVALVAAALVGLFVAQLRFAARPGGGPFGLSERRRTLYVYAAEALLLGLFLHVRLNMPWLFGSQFVHYWPLLVMGIAYLSVGLAEVFHRRGLPVFAGPLRRTGLALPLLPLLAFWVRPPDSLQAFLESRAPGTVPLLAALNKLPTYHTGPFDRYALLWFLLGMLYAVVALARRSPRYALFGALAANVGLWCLLYDAGWAFVAHPQLWLVPLALIVLVSEHLNRERLGPAAATTLRYAGLGLMYLSSTADMFIAGLGRSAVLPLVLALLSVAGVLAGIVLRVRAFLLLGVGFLGLVVFSMIWHAAVDLAQTWVWWASGIVLGLAILALFALFEKRRNDVLRVVEQVRRWD